MSIGLPLEGVRVQSEGLTNFFNQIFDPSQRRLIPVLYAGATTEAQQAAQELLYTAWNCNQEGVKAGQMAIDILSNPTYGYPLTQQ